MFSLMILITGISMLRIGYNQNIVYSYESSTKILPERTKIGMMDRFWQEYTGGTRRNVSQIEAQRAERAIVSVYGFMISANVILIFAVGISFLKPVMVERLKK